MIKNIFLFFLVLTSISLNAQLSDFKDVNFKKADSIANSFKGENLRSLPILSNKLTHSLSTDVEKFRAIYIWVCSNIENDYRSFLKNASERKKLRNDSLKLVKWNKEFSSKVFKKLLYEQKTVCTGYAYLIKELSNLSNINCEMVNGYGRTAFENAEDFYIPNHSWNAVQLNNKWYLCDATWSSGIFDLEEYSFEYKYNNGYFLTNPEMFSKNHYPLEVKWLLTEKTQNINAFFKAPLIYGEAFKCELMPIEPITMHIEVKKNEEVTFLYKELDSIGDKEIKFEIISGKYTNTIKPTINRTKEGLLELKCLFKFRGTFDVHLKINDDYIITYVVKVKKK